MHETSATLGFLFCGDKDELAAHLLELRARIAGPEFFPV
jgi:hypothetical protein